MEQIRVKTSSNFNDEEITDIKLLGVATSLREDSHSTHALKILLEVAANKYGAKARLLELRKTKLPLV